MMKKYYVTSTIAAALITAASLTCCRPVQQGSASGSNLSITDKEASLALTLQQDQTELVRTRIGNVKKALAPIEDALAELNKLADIKVNGESGLHLSTFMKRFQDVLRESVHGTPVALADNSWVIERKIEINDVNDDTVKAFNAQACMLEIKGNTVDSREVLTVSLMKCHTDQWTPIAQMTYSKSGRIDVTYSPANISQFLPHTIEMKVNYEKLIKGCDIQIVHDEVVMVCEPFSLKGDRYAIDVKKLSILTNKNGTQTSVNADLIEQGSQKLMGSLELVNGKAKVMIDTKDVQVSAPTQPTPLSLPVTADSSR